MIHHWHDIPAGEDFTDMFPMVVEIRGFQDPDAVQETLRECRRLYEEKFPDLAGSELAHRSGQ